MRVIDPQGSLDPRGDWQELCWGALDVATCTYQIYNGFKEDFFSFSQASMGAIGPWGVASFDHRGLIYVGYH